MIAVSLVTVVAVLLLDIGLSFADPQIVNIGLRRSRRPTEQVTIDPRATQPAPPIIGA